MTQKTLEEIYKEIPALKKYPEDIARQLYTELNPKKDLCDLTEGEYVNGAEVLVVRVLNQSFYIGCPTCYTKKDGMEEGVTFECKSNRCNAQRVATKLPRWTLLAGDQTTKAILDFPPFGYKLADGNALVAKVVSVKGSVSSMRDQKVNGEVKGKTPVIMVRDLKIVSDIRDGEEHKEAPPAPIGEGPEGLPNPPVSPNIASLPAPKLKAFQTWMAVMTKDKPVAEAQVKMYVENNLKINFVDVLPLLDRSYSDQLATNIYTLKTQK